MTRSDFDIEPFTFRDMPTPRFRARRPGRRPRPERYEFETLDLESPASTPTLRLGSRGSAVIDLQTRLATAGFSAGTADGIFGSRTDAAVRSFQRARGLGVDGVVGPQTWNELLGTTTAPQPAPSTGSPSDPQVTIPSGVLISANAVRVLEDILRAARLTRATVTSGRRTSTDQARVMYELIERNGVSYAKNLYGSSGDKVIDEYVAAKAAGKSSTAIKLAMESKVKQLGCPNVSHHCSDSYDVFDVSPLSISDSSAFRRALDSAVFSGAIKMYIAPPEDPAFHIEIALAPSSGELHGW
jgi:peptidoglycan hydrolase-like protein with peptidoglycan-binding domain